MSGSNGKKVQNPWTQRSKVIINIVNCGLQFWTHAWNFGVQSSYWTFSNWNKIQINLSKQVKELKFTEISMNG